MTNIEEIKKKLSLPSGYALIPIAYETAPLPFPEWEIQDKDGNATGEYWSPKTLSKELGSLLKLTDRINGQWFLMRYGLDWDTVYGVTNYLKSVGLIDPRENEDGTLKAVSDVDFTTFTGNEFMIVPVHQAGDIPKVVPELLPQEDDA